MIRTFATTLLSATVLVSPAFADLLDLEVDELRLGFIKLTDMAPLAVAYEQGYFVDEGLFVTLEPQANWKVLLDGVITGELARRAHAGRPAARRHDRLRHRGAYRHAVFDGPQRQRYHRVQRGLGDDEARASPR